MYKITETITSPNQSTRNGYIPKIIVCHIADGSYNGTKAWFSNSNSQTSSHYIVAQDGRICQCVGLDKMAWCNGTNHSPGDSRYYGYSTVPTVLENGGNANWYSISIEHEGYYSKTKGELTDKQLEATAWLVSHIVSEVNKMYGEAIPVDRDHIVGHYEINPITKPCCPGERFQWVDLLAMIPNGSNTSTDDIAYRIQLGYFEVKENAYNYIKEVKNVFPEAFISTDGDKTGYRIQLGYFEDKTNAYKYLDEVKKSFPSAFIKVGNKK